MRSINEIVTTLPFYDILTEQQNRSISQNAEIREYKKGDVIGCSDGRCIGPFVILEGEIRAMMSDENLREITLFRLYPNDMGLLSAACVLEHITFESNFVMDTDCVLFVVDARVFKKVIEENVFVKCAVFEILTDRFSACMETMYSVFFTRYDKRMAAFLLEKHSVSGQKEFAITQEELAKLTSTAREVAGRTIRKFAEEGILEYGRGKIKLFDIRKLNRIANEN